MKLFFLLIGALLILVTGCSSDEHYPRGGYYGDEVHPSYGHGEDTPERQFRHPYDRDFL